MKITDKNKMITVDQAFRTMILYLNMYYGEFNSDILGNILSELQICPDGETVDPAAGEDWKKCLEEAIADDNAGRYIIDLTKAKE